MLNMGFKDDVETILQALRTHTLTTTHSLTHTHTHTHTCI